MRLLLSSPPFEELGTGARQGHIRVCPNLGLYLMAALIEEHGHQVRLVDPVDFDSTFGSDDSLAAALSGIDMLGLSVNSCTWPLARRFLQDLEERRLRPLTVVGGPHPSILDEYVLQSSPVDYIVRGEAERSLPELIERLARGLDPAGVAGISFIKNRELIRTPPPTLLSPEELAELPLPRFELMPEGYYDLIPVETSRGCFHSCLFCSVSFKRNWRGIGAKAVAERIRRLVPHLSRTTRKALFIIDDCFTADHERIKEIAHELAGLEGELAFEARITDVITPGVLDALLRLPVGVMEMGVECGYEDGLAKVGKRLSLDQVEQARALLSEREVGDKARFSFIMGLPWETRTEVMKTMEYAFKLTGGLGARLITSWLTVFPGSRIWHRQGEWGVDIEAVDFDREHWWREEGVFRRTHPGLDPDRDIEAVMTYVAMLIKLFPRIRHDGFFRELC